MLCHSCHYEGAGSGSKFCSRCRESMASYYDEFARDERERRWHEARERDKAEAERDKLRERVDYLENAIKLGGAAYRAARVGLGAPAVELDDYLGLRERAEQAEAALARLREIADYHADKGGTDLDRALRSVGR